MCNCEEKSEYISIAKHDDRKSVTNATQGVYWAYMESRQWCKYTCGEVRQLGEGAKRQGAPWNSIKYDL